MLVLIFLFCLSFKELLCYKIRQITFAQFWFWLQAYVCAALHEHDCAALVRDFWTPEKDRPWERDSSKCAQMSRLMTKPTKWHGRPAKTQISLGICRVWSESLLSAGRKLGSLATHWAQAKALIRLGGCLGWSESFLGAQSFCWFCHEGAYMFARQFVNTIGQLWWGTSARPWERDGTKSAQMMK